MHVQPWPLANRSTARCWVRERACLRLHAFIYSRPPNILRHSRGCAVRLAGAWVNPYTAALEAGLDPDSPYYRKAMEYLQAEDVLEWAEETRELAGSPIYTITLRGMEMLREV